MENAVYPPGGNVRSHPPHPKRATRPPRGSKRDQRVWGPPCFFLRTSLLSFIIFPISCHFPFSYLLSSPSPAISLFFLFLSFPDELHERYSALCSTSADPRREDLSPPPETWTAPTSPLPLHAPRIPLPLSLLRQPSTCPDLPSRPQLGHTVANVARGGSEGSPSPAAPHLGDRTRPSPSCGPRSHAGLDDGMLLQALTNAATLGDRRCCHGWSAL
jgi:hypothetical protein